MPRPRGSGKGRNPAAANGKGNRPRFPRAVRGKPGAGQGVLFEEAGAPESGATKRSGRTGRVRVPKASARTTAWGADQLDEIPPMVSLDSSRIREAGYQPKTQTLYVRFVDGTPWEYRDVPVSVWRNLRRSASPGRFVNRVLNQYDYGKSNF